MKVFEAALSFGKFIGNSLKSNLPKFITCGGNFCNSVGFFWRCARVRSPAAMAHLSFRQTSPATQRGFFVRRQL